MSNQTVCRPILVGKYDITLDGTKISYTLKRSQRAKLIWLNINRPTGLTVTIPPNYKLIYVEEYLIDNKRWILTNMAKHCCGVPETPAVDTHPAHTVSYLGKCLTVTQRRNNKGMTAVTLEENNLVFNQKYPGSKLSSRELETWLKSEAVRIINEKVQQFSQEMKLVYNRVKIRDQKSRWGSCSCRKNLNFNWRLVMAPEPVLDYVVIHELCHLKEMSHSKSFWNLVAQYCPLWSERRSWLDDHCFELNTKVHP